MATQQVQRGFTIIEITVVLVIFSVLAAIALPNLNRLYDAYINRVLVDEIIDVAESASIYAYGQGKTIELKRFVEERVELPSGWAFVQNKAITISAIGVCSGGQLQIASPDKLVTLQLTPPFCSIAQ